MTLQEHNHQIRKGVTALKYAMLKHGFPRKWELGGGRASDGTETPYYVKTERGRYEGTTGALEAVLRACVAECKAVQW